MSLVYVQSKNGTPLMPTRNNRMVRLLLKEGKAKVVTRTPFTIRLLVTVNTYKQDITLGVDAGSKYVGMSATTEKQELYASQTELRNDIPAKLATRREFRRSRRNRKTRYRKARFDNRVKSKRKGWLAPSVMQKINSHIQLVKNVCRILPVAHIIVEVASFDIQKIKNPDIKGIEYQQGEQLDSYNTREYVLFRDGHECQCCHGKSGDKILEVHHIESRKTGGNAPNNLITLCKTCHDGYHNGTVKPPENIKRGKSFRDASLMGIMRLGVYNELKEIYPDVQKTYGYITKNTRIMHNIEKGHINDARCISRHPDAEPAGEYYYQKCTRRHNRQIHKANILKGGKRKANQAPKYVYGYQLYDKVKCNHKVGFIWGRRSSGFFAVKDLDGDVISNSISCKKLKLAEKAKSVLCERRTGAPPMFKNTGVRA